jgi:hypothetical protein
MPDDIEAAALCARLKAIVEEAEDAEAQAAAARRRVQAARLLIVVFPGRGLVARPHRLFDL